MLEPKKVSAASLARLSQSSSVPFAVRAISSPINRYCFRGNRGVVSSIFPPPVVSSCSISQPAAVAFETLSVTISYPLVLAAPYIAAIPTRLRDIFFISVSVSGPFKGVCLSNTLRNITFPIPPALSAIYSIEENIKRGKGAIVVRPYLVIKFDISLSGAVLGAAA